ncbi:MAG: CFI-box-CTERM domain-containing protein, partial [Candidatus Hydrogenedentota bacterium]
GGGGGGGGGSCFIATAAYGTPMAQEIDTLRAVRDTYMLNNFVGSAFVDTYYRLSPVVADKVAENPALASLVRALLTPVVLLSGIFLAAPSSAWIACVALFSMVVYMRQHRKSRRYSK